MMSCDVLPQLAGKLTQLGLSQNQSTFTGAHGLENSSTFQCLAVAAVAFRLPSTASNRRSKYIESDRIVKIWGAETCSGPRQSQ